jgi:CRP-like cAMP-binding protein
MQILDAALRQPRTIPIPRWITPKHYQFTVTECFGHASFVLVALSYAVDDFLLLRIIAVAGSASMLVFTYFHPHGRVLWLPFKWNVLFILINAYRIGKVYWSRYAAEHLLPNELIELRKRSFFLMDPVDYYRLVRIAEIQEYKNGDLLLAQGERVHTVRMVLSGRLRVLRDGKLTYFLEEGNFISEAGIHVGLLLPGKIESCCSIVADGKSKDDIARVLCWNRTELVHLMELHEGVRRSVKAILSWDIVRKLKAQRFIGKNLLSEEFDAWTERRNQQTMHRYAAILHNILNHPLQLLKQNRKQVSKYRTIHHVDDEQHAKALAECGWTVEEYEAGGRNRQYRTSKRMTVHLLDDPDDDEFEDLIRSVEADVDYDDLPEEEEEETFRDWQWYVRDFYLRFFG